MCGLRYVEDQRNSYTAFALDDLVGPSNGYRKGNGWCSDPTSTRARSSRWSRGEALEALGEAIVVIRKIWSGERNLRYEGRHYRLAGAQSGPVPAHPIGIWLGVFGPRALELTARVADGWVPSFHGRLAPIADMSRRLDDAVAAAGRNPAELRRVLNVAGVITDGASDGPLRGPVEQWADELTELAVEYGFDTFIFWGEGVDQLERFGEEVIPATRQREATAR
jgi:alkanesulfonate monooxygenase SsuD/methylene tetrahydromethanopterin reductase-like flavin-dependent oxidoreductase (luciferase family)